MQTAYGAEGVSAGARMDRLPICKLHYKILFLVGAGLFLDAFEIYLAGGVLGALTKSGWSNLELNARFVSTTFAGMVVGAWGAGIIGDWLGRRATYQANLAIFGLASFGAVFAPDMTWLIVFRFFMGIGLGAEIVVSYATLSEYVPGAVRGRWIALLAVITNSALFVSAFVGMWIIPTLGWRWMFGMVGVGALVVWAARKSMPESPRWLEAKGRYAEAEEVLQRFEAEAAAKGPLAPYVPVRLVKPEPVSFLVLFTPPVLRRTLISVMIHIVTNITIYGFIAWLPTFFIKSGHSVAASLAWTTVMSLGGPVGALLSYFIADHVGRKPVVILSSLGAAGFGLIYPYMPDGVPLMLVGFLLVTCVYVLVATGFALYVPEIFPTHYRLRGTGMANTAGRLVTAFVQTAVVALFSWGGVGAVIGTLSSILVLQAIIMAIFGFETRQQSLEVSSSGPGGPNLTGRPLTAGGD